VIFIVIGVSGVGKTTIGRALAQQRNIDFIDADDFHPTSNVSKMAAGIPLNDTDRIPWLKAINLHLNSLGNEQGIVLACSALKESYRKLLSENLEHKINWITLEGSFEVIRKRMEERSHFMPPELLQSQFRDFEKPTYGICLDVVLSPEQIINKISQSLAMNKKAEIGLIGLGVMGKSLARNIAQKGFLINVFNRHVEGLEENVAIDFVQSFPELAQSKGFDGLEDFVLSLERPRKIMLMVNAGAAVDIVIDKLLPILDKNDLIIDGGNSNYKDTARRFEALEGEGILFIGTGVSGGEAGALNGPSIMPGGSIEAYNLVANILESISAKDKNGGPCCSFIGKSGSGHFVKMVHNGIEYAEMQLIAEVYGLLRFLDGYAVEKISALFSEWAHTDSASYLLEITAKILLKKEKDVPLIDLILDKAGNKGTGSWTTISACELGVPIPTITAALFARYQSAQFDTRQKASQIFQKESTKGAFSLDDLRTAYQQARIINHHQGFDLIKSASDHFDWDINLSELGRVWTNGCIIRSDFMELIAQHFDHTNSILLNPHLNKSILSKPTALKQLAVSSSVSDVAIPCFSSALNYLNAFKEKRSLANIIQAQRDFFGAHTYERTDAPSGQKFHTEWE